MDDLDLYKIVLEDDEITFTGMNMISLVEDPAIRETFLAFNKVKQFHFNVDQQILVGPIAIPDIKIPRFDPEIGYFNVFFPKDVIVKLQERFQKNDFNRNINVSHSDQMVDAYLMESWIKEFADNDKSNGYGFDLPVGTLFGSVKIEDSKFWNEVVKTGEVKGFSLELLSGIERVEKFQKWQDAMLEGMPEGTFNEIQKVLDRLKKES